MRRFRLPPLAALLAAALMAPGCAPVVMSSVETIVFPDYTVQRVTRMEAFPNPRFPGQKPRLGDYFQFPPAELYDSYAVQQDKVLFAGTFESFDQIPHDLVRATPGSAIPAGNVFSFRVMDLVLFVLADFDETLTDIVAGREDGEAAMTELLQLAVPEVMSVLNAKYGAQYDLGRLDAWLRNELPQKLRRVYAGAWAIHSAKRSGVTSPGEDYEYYMFLKAEARREGLELAEPGTPDMQQENIRRLREYAVRLAESLCPPRQGGAGVTRETFSGVALDELAAAIQKAITARHGSINNFIGKIAALVPRAFGAYLTGTVMPVYMLPETTYQYRLRIPGAIIQTNGVRELGGDLVWTFTDRDLAFTGQSMWARSIFVREAGVYALGLRGFPASLADVDRLFGLCLSPSGAPREEILKALRQSVAERNTAALESIANSPSSPDAQAARGIMELFDRHRKNPGTGPADPVLNQPPQPPSATPQPPQPSPPPPQPSPPPPQPSPPPPQPSLPSPPPQSPPPPSGSASNSPGAAQALAPMQAIAQPEAPAPAQPPAPRPELPAIPGQTSQPRASLARDALGGIEPPPLPPPAR